MSWNLDVGVIGTGFMGKNHIRVYSQMKDVREIFVSDINEEIAHKISEMYENVTPCKTSDEVMDRVEVLSICTPNNTHLKYARQSTESGIHTLIEKPISDYTDIKFSYQDEIIVGVGHIERFNPIVEEIRKLMTKPKFIKLMRHNPSSDRHKGVTSVIEDLMIHDIDVLLHSLMVGEKVKDISSYTTSDIAAAQVLYECGTIAELSASRESAKKIRSIYIECPNITIEGDYLAQEVYVYRKPDKYSTKDQKYIQENIVEKVLVNRVEPLQVELKTFIDCVKTGCDFPVSPLDGFDNLAFCYRIKMGDNI